jgi:negative regulator of genetic competence, sporulation and motility
MMVKEVFMELIVINENKLKIIMSAQDMKDFCIDENEFHLSMTDTRQILSRILKASSTKTGFEDISKDDKLLLQLYSDTYGGCELFVTRLKLESEEDIFMPQGNEKFLLPKSTTKNAEHKKNTFTYSFERLDFVISVCKELKKRNFCGESSIQKLDNGKYLLFVSSDGIQNSFLNCLSEFGELENTEISHLHSLERGTSIISSSAVEKLSNL